MRIWTREEAGRVVDVERFGSQPSRPQDGHEVRVYFEDCPWTKIPLLLSRAVDAIGPCNWWVLRLDEGPGQWSGGPLHLYYRVRQAYGDARLLQEAPFHFCFRHEEADLQTLLTVALLNLWDVQLVSDSDYGSLFISHSEWLSVWSNSSLDGFRAQMSEAGLRSEIEG